MRPRFADAWRQASVAASEVEVTSDGGPLGNVDLCCFIKTLHDRAHYAAATTGALIIVVAQP